MNIRLQLTRPQRRRFQMLLRKTKSRIEALRARVLLLLHERVEPAEVARMVGCVRATVYRTIYRFEDVGEQCIQDRRALRLPIKVTPTVVDRLLALVDEDPRELGWSRANWTLECLALQVERDLNVRLSPSCARNVLVRGHCRRGRPCPALRIPVRGRRRVLRRIARLVGRANPAGEVFYADEADVDLLPRIGATYMRRGTQRLVFTPGTNKKRYVAGALNARTGRVVYIWGEKRNSQLFLSLIEVLRSLYRRSRVLHLVVDNAIFHKSRVTLARLQALAGRVVLHFLPPYSPESNMIERLWKQMHDHVTRNHRHTELDSLMAAVEEFLDAAQPFPGAKVSTMRRAA